MESWRGWRAMYVRNERRAWLLWCVLIGLFLLVVAGLAAMLAGWWPI